MKQKILSLLSLCVMVLCSQNLWAERVAPTLPEATLESGGVYYLYNVEANSFLAYAPNTDSSMGINENPEPIEITLLENGAYTLRIANSEIGYIYSYDERTSTNYPYYGADSEVCFWSITPAEENGFLIQRSVLNRYYYNADEYLGWQGDNATSVLANRPITDGVHWKLIPADAEGNRYVASLKLFKALNMTDAFLENGWNFDYYVNLYAERSTADVEEMTQAAYGLRNGLNMSAGYKAPYWNEYPIFWQTSDGTYGEGENYTWRLGSVSYGKKIHFFSRALYYDKKSSTITATVKNDEISTFIYSTNVSYPEDLPSLKVYVDGVMVRELNYDQATRLSNLANDEYPRFSEVLQPGTHTIKFVFEKNVADDSGVVSCALVDVGVMKSPLISVNLLEPGSLGTEVLYNTDHVKNVRRLKVKGKMNSDDWSKLKMMPYLQDLDLSEADIMEIPDGQFSCSIEADTSSLFLHAIKLPEGLKKIGAQAFTCSFVDCIQMPSTLEEVGAYAFCGSHVKELILPDNLTNIAGGKYYRGWTTFGGMLWLEKLVCPKNMTNIPDYVFYWNPYCKEVTLPEKLEVISDFAFYQNRSMTITNIPESLTTIGGYAFYDCDGLDKLIMPKDMTYVGENAFSNCDNLTEVELPVNIYELSKYVFSGCTHLETLRLNSPTVASYAKDYYGVYYPVDADKIQNVNLVVPNHIVSAYKLDNYWYNFKSIEGFSSSEIQDWTINNPLVLNHERLEGTPNIKVCGNETRMPYLKINGDTPMAINDLCFGDTELDPYHVKFNAPGQFLSNCNYLTIEGNVTSELYTKAMNWYFFSLPFDVKVSEITHDIEGVQMAIRYYDGANRAENGPTGSWKNFEEDAVIPAGSGFIVQTNVDTKNYFHAMDNASKQNCVSNKDFVKTLDVNDSETESNKGWNLVGNPWQCYFNDHSLNFTAPITVWDVQNRTYIAYSITDDDYAIRPNEAFFVQCPGEDYATIGFPVQGRQLNDVIETQNAVKAFVPQAAARKLVNLTLTNGEQKDQTRVVLNEKASLGYETICDASKFLSMDASVPQLYSLDMDGTQYAINERPMSEGSVKLGFMAPADGSYTIALGRCDLENVYLKDNKTNETIALTEDGYTFEAETGVDDERFTLCFNAGEATGIEKTEMTDEGDKAVYSIDGKYVGTEPKKLDNGVYIIRKGKNTSKVVVR